MTTIDEAIDYFKMAEAEGFYSPSTRLLSRMTEEEIIALAEELGEKGNFLAQVNE